MIFFTVAELQLLVPSMITTLACDTGMDHMVAAPYRKGKILELCCWRYALTRDWRKTKPARPLGGVRNGCRLLAALFDSPCPFAP